MERGKSTLEPLEAHREAVRGSQGYGVLSSSDGWQGGGLNFGYQIMTAENSASNSAGAWAGVVESNYNNGWNYFG